MIMYSNLRNAQNSAQLNHFSSKYYDVRLIRRPFFMSIQILIIKIFYRCLIVLGTILLYLLLEQCYSTLLRLLQISCSWNNFHFAFLRLSQISCSWNNFTLLF